MPIQTPNERSDLYDSYDVREHDFVPSAAYRDATMPVWMRNAIMARAHQRQAETDNTALPTVGVVQVMEVEPVVKLVQNWRNESSVTVVSLAGNRTGNNDTLRTAEVKALRDLADRLEHNNIQPGPLVVNILVEP